MFYYCFISLKDCGPVIGQSRIAGLQSLTQNCLGQNRKSNPPTCLAGAGVWLVSPDNHMLGAQDMVWDAWSAVAQHPEPRTWMQDAGKLGCRWGSEVEMSLCPGPWAAFLLGCLGVFPAKSGA